MSRKPVPGADPTETRKENTAEPIGETPRLTWALLVAHEPQLGRLLAGIRAIRARRGFCANSVWLGYHGGGFERRLGQLVGWCRKDDPILGTRRAYDLAHHVLYEALPDCRHESPFC